MKPQTDVRYKRKSNIKEGIKKIQGSSKKLNLKTSTDQIQELLKNSKSASGLPDLSKVKTKNSISQRKIKEKKNSFTYDGIISQHDKLFRKGKVQAQPSNDYLETFDHKKMMKSFE